MRGIRHFIRALVPFVVSSTQALVALQRVGHRPTSEEKAQAVGEAAALANR